MNVSRSIILQGTAAPVSLLVIAALLVCNATANADTHYVSLSGAHRYPYTNWATAATNIQAGIDAAAVDDLVLISGGTYRLQSELIVTNRISLMAVSIADPPVVDAERKARCLYLNATGAVIDGVTFTHGATAVPGNTGPSFGGGVYALAGVVRNCHVVSNGAYIGGGIALEDGATAEGCYVAYNDGGGGVTLWGGSVLRDCLVERNTSSLGGGGVGAGDGSHVIDCTVRENDPGGVGLIYGSTAIGCAILDNPGGGIGMLGPGNVASNCTIMGNSFGGVWFSGDADTLVNCIISENAGTGIVFDGDANRLLNCIVVGNTTGIVFSAGDTTIQNCIVTDNGTENWIDSGGAFTASHTCTTPLPPGIGNITNDPQLTPSYRLKSTSPCIDAGTWSNAPATDIDGEARWDHPWHSNLVSIVDIGADEFVDVDHDNVADSWEIDNFGSVTNTDGTADGDNDGLNDLGEYENSTCPTNWDTDADLMGDGWEVGNSLDPLSAADALEDPDSDSVANVDEFANGTNPWNPDTDFDGFWDGTEIEENSYPLDPGAYPGLQWTGSDHIAGSWRWLDWFGWFYVRDYPWIYHLQHGWVYPSGVNTDFMWLYALDMEWLWTTQGLYSNLYRLKDATWLYYLKDSEDPRWFYNWTTGEWEAHW